MLADNPNFTQPMQPWPPLSDFGNYIFLPNQNLNLFYFEAGDEHEKTLLMLHGLGDEADTWRHVFQPLAESFHTLAIDLPGFGRSDQPDVVYDPNFYIKCIFEFISLRAKSTPILMGSSLGGMLAHGLALTHSECVDGLILVGGALSPAELNQTISLRLMQLPFIGEWLYTRLRKNPDAAFSSLNSVYYQLEALPGVDREFLFNRVNQRVWSDGQRRAYFSTLRQLARWAKRIQADLPEKLSLLEIPTLILRGEYDTLFPDATAEAIINIQPLATKGIIKNAGHLPQQEAPENTLNIINNWIADSL